MTRILAALALPALAIACAPAEPEDDFVSDAPAVRVTGDPVSCIDTRRITRQTVHDDYTIDFEVGGTTYRNTLPARCPGLGFDEAFTFNSPTTRLCSNEIISTLERQGGELRRGVGCSLGEFVPVEYVEGGEGVTPD